MKSKSKKSRPKAKPKQTKPTESAAINPGPKFEEMSTQIEGLLVSGIERVDREKCILEDGTAFPDSNNEEENEEHLRRFIRERVYGIAKHEYSRWLNGKMPFVTFRELQLWRLRMYSEILWFWNLPDEDSLAAILNLTRRKAANLIDELHARFGKIYLFPRIVARILRIVEEQHYYEKDIDEIPGYVYIVPASYYLRDVNYLIFHINTTLLAAGDDALPEARFVSRGKRFMWISKDIVIFLRQENNQKDLLKLFPVDSRHEE